MANSGNKYGTSFTPPAPWALTHTNFRFFPCPGWSPVTTVLQSLQSHARHTLALVVPAPAPFSACQSCSEHDRWCPVPQYKAVKPLARRSRGHAWGHLGFLSLPSVTNIECQRTCFIIIMYTRSTGRHRVSHRRNLVFWHKLLPAAMHGLHRSAGLQIILLWHCWRKKNQDGNSR